MCHTLRIHQWRDVSVLFKQGSALMRSAGSRSPLPGSEFWPCCEETVWSCMSCLTFLYVSVSSVKWGYELDVTPRNAVDFKWINSSHGQELANGKHSVIKVLLKLTPLTQVLHLSFKAELNFYSSVKLSLDWPSPEFLSFFLSANIYSLDGK